MPEPKLIILIGPPGSGKSTWTKKYLETNPNTIVLSTDNIIEEYARIHSINYNEAFKTLNQNALEKQMFGDFEEAIQNKEDIIVDRTNMTEKGRNKFLSKIPSCYQKIAMDFKVSKEVVKDRLKEREERTGKHIPQIVVNQMFSNYQSPNLEEFDIIRLVKE